MAAVEVVDCVPLISVHSLNEHNSPASFLLNIKEASQIWKGEKVLKQYDITRIFDSPRWWIQARVALPCAYHYSPGTRMAMIADQTQSVFPGKHRHPNVD